MLPGPPGRPGGADRCTDIIATHRRAPGKDQL